MRLEAVVVAALVAVPLLSAAAAAQATGADCEGPPCPPFPARIYIAVGDTEDFEVDRGDLPVEVPATVTWRFDVDRYMLAVWEPQDPPQVELGFPTTPAWIEPSVEPASYEVPMSPETVHTDVSDPDDPTVRYVHHRNVTLTLETADDATPSPDDPSDWRMGLSAKSSRSGAIAAAFGYGGIAIAQDEPDTTGSTSAATLPGLGSVAVIAAAGVAVAWRARCRP